VLRDELALLRPVHGASKTIVVIGFDASATQAALVRLLGSASSCYRGMMADTRSRCSASCLANHTSATWESLCTGHIDSVLRIHHEIFDFDPTSPWRNTMCRNGKCSACSLASSLADASATGPTSMNSLFMTSKPRRVTATMTLSVVSDVERDRDDDVVGGE
jgi:hypothetical protein